jgi:branched-chain amino acid transport system substrate-binding protein
MTRTCARLAALCCGALLIACGGGTTRQPTPATVATPPLAAITVGAGQPIIIGLSAALSGDQASLGNDLADAADLAISDHGGAVKGHSLKVERVDDRCTDAEKATQVARTLLSEAALGGVVGPMCTTGAQAADKIYEAAAVVHISPSVTRADVSQEGERFFFRVAWRDDVEAAVQSSYAAGTLNVRSVTLVDDGGPYGKALADAFAAAFQQTGGNVLSRERIDPTAADFSSLAQQVKSANPDAVVFEGLNPGGASIAKALHEAAYPGKFIAPDGVLSTRDFITPAGPAAEGAIITGGPMIPDAFATHFQDRFQRAPGTPFVLQTHDAVTSLIVAIESCAVEGAGGTLVIDRAKLADTLRGQKLSGWTGSIQFDESGDRRGTTAAEAGLVIYRVVNGRFEPVP